MKDQDLDSFQFCHQLDLMFAEVASDISGRSSAPGCPKWSDPNFENDLRIKVEEKVDLIVLSILSHYLSEELRALLQLKLEIKFQKNVDLFPLVLLLREGWKSYLCETTEWHTRGFFGNIVTKKRLKRLRYYFSLRFKPKDQPKRVQRHRGYRDKGTLRASHEHHNYYEASMEDILERDERPEVIQDTINFIEGWFT